MTADDSVPLASFYLFDEAEALLADSRAEESRRGQEPPGCCGSQQAGPPAPSPRIAADVGEPVMTRQNICNKLL